jgi:hypothetical protein
VDAEAYADMLPWLVFLVIDRKSGLGVAWAGGGALVCSTGLAGWSYWRGRHALVPRAAMAIFAAFLVSGLASQSWNQHVSLPRALVLASLSALAFGSLPFTPLSEAYTVPLVAPALRDDPRFARVNVEITLAWGVGAIAVAVTSAATALLSGPMAFTFLDWVTPLVLAAGTVLWSTRRWELFRLAVDSVVVSREPVDTAMPIQAAAHDQYGTAFSARRPRPFPVELAGSERRASGQREPAERTGGAVIRHLPPRRNSRLRRGNV